MGSLQEEDWICEIQKELDEYVKEKSAFYNFDFAFGDPLNKDSGRFAWDKEKSIQIDRRPSPRVIHIKQSIAPLFSK